MELLNDSGIRGRDDSAESSQKTRVREDSAVSYEKKRVRDDSAESDLDSPEVKRLRDDLLGVLDELEPEPVSQELDSVIKSFEDELSAASTSTVAHASGENQPDLGYLLEASDDELGLPPPTSSATKEAEKEETDGELFRVPSDSSGIGEYWGFGDPIASYDSFELGIGDSCGGDYVAGDGLFEYSDLCFDSGDSSSWRQETLPAE